MIGQFWFAEIAPDGHIALILAWVDGEAVGKVQAPQSVLASLQALNFPIRTEDDYVQLSIGLGYAVLVAGAGKTPLTISGDCSAWPSIWGALKAREALTWTREQAH